MKNMISGKTLREFQLELGVAKGLREFTSRCRGRTLGESYVLIGELMTGTTGTTTVNVEDYSKGVDGSSTVRDVKSIVEKMGLVGFTFEMVSQCRARITYYPFSVEV